jgi:hypothetical protein
MNNRRPILAAAIALSALAGGIAAASSAGAQSPNYGKVTTTAKATKSTKAPKAPKTTKTTIKQRTKNAALPPTTTRSPTTTRPKTVTTPLPKLPTNTVKR